MEKLYDLHQRYLRQTNTGFQRYLLDEVSWNHRLIALKGPKGVGKTTMLLQHILQHFGEGTDALYVSMDSIAIKSFTLFEIAEFHANRGGSHLFLDEIHKYSDWSRELKTIYDLFPELHIVFSGSSMLQIYKSYGDLSRRAITYDLRGLSFREYLILETGEQLEAYNLKSILTDHLELAKSISERVKVFDHFDPYLRFGYYPFYREGTDNYYIKLEQVINTILDVDLPFMVEINAHNIYKMKKLLYMLATSVPFQPNISKLAASLEVNRNTLSNYIHYLHEAGLLQLLLDAGKSYSLLAKPEKIYLQNANLVYVISPEHAQKGTLREMFFFNQVAAKHKVNYSKEGDFLVDEHYTFEVGGHSKNFNQIKRSKNSYLVLDDTIMGYKNKIPLWLFGFLY
ncbi:MAG: AAA family ATPase [Saprospiraceae bacterium]|nr:AAA family ATPase [Saprospiraceae bacterium]